MNSFGVGLILQIAQMTFGLVYQELMNGDLDKLADPTSPLGKLVYYAKYLSDLAHGGTHAAASVPQHVAAPAIPHPPATPLTKEGLLSWAASLPTPQHSA